MTNRGIKQMLFGLAIVLFSLVLVFAAFVFLLSEIAGAAINSPSPIGQGVSWIVFVALGVGIAGLVVVFAAFDRTD